MLLSSLEGKHRVIYTMGEQPILIDQKNGIWKVRTESSLYEYRDDAWKKNPRFDDFIDVSPRYRI
jgi:hypothetical protein